MRTYLYTLIIGLLCIAGFNFGVDPAHRWHSSVWSGAKLWRNDQCWISAKDFDERSFRRQQLNGLSGTLDLVFLGSSRVMQARSATLDPALRVYNAGMSGASIEDYLAIWQELKTLNKIPKYLVIFVDPWIFNVNNKQDRWRTNLDLYRNYIQDLVFQQKHWGFALAGAKLSVQGMLKYWNEFSELLSWEVFKASVMALHDGALSGEGEVVMATDAKINEHGCWYADGSRSYSRMTNKVLTPDELRASAIKYASGDVYSLDSWKFNNTSLKLLKSLLSEAYASGARTLLVAPPYQKTVVSVLSQRPDYSSILPEYLALMQRLPHATFCNALEHDKFGCAETEFMDGAHMHASCAQKVVRHCFKQAGWATLLDSI